MRKKWTKQERDEVVDRVAALHEEGLAPTVIGERLRLSRYYVHTMMWEAGLVKAKWTEEQREEIKRKVLFFRHSGGMTHTAIARRIGIARSTVNEMLREAS